VLQCVAVCCSVLQGAAVCCCVLQCVAACVLRVLQCVAMCCSVLLPYHGNDRSWQREFLEKAVRFYHPVLQCVAARCSVLQCVFIRVT